MLSYMTCVSVAKSSLSFVVNNDGHNFATPYIFSQGPKNEERRDRDKASSSSATVTTNTVDRFFAKNHLYYKLVSKYFK